MIRLDDIVREVDCIRNLIQCMDSSSPELRGKAFGLFEILSEVRSPPTVYILSPLARSDHEDCSGIERRRCAKEYDWQRAA